MTRRSSIYSRSSKTPVRQFVADVEDVPMGAHHFGDVTNMVGKAIPQAGDLPKPVAPAPPRGEP